MPQFVTAAACVPPNDDACVERMTATLPAPRLPASTGSFADLASKNQSCFNAPTAWISKLTSAMRRRSESYVMLLKQSDAVEASTFSGDVA